MKHTLLGIFFIILSQAETLLGADPLTLSAFLKAVESENPEIKVEQSLTEESTARVPGYRLNPPMVGIMSMRDGSETNLGVEIAQEIPFPTKLFQEKAIRRLESEATQSSFEYKKSEVLLAARTAYFDFWRSFNTLQITKEKRDWLRTHARITRSATRADSAAQVHLLGVQSEVDLLENEVLEAETTLIEKRSALKTFAPSLVEDQLTPIEPELKAIEVNKNLKSSFIASKELEVSVAEANQSFASKASLPDLYVRYRGYNGTAMSPKSEELMLGVTLPFLYFWQPKAESAEASAKMQRANTELQKAKVDSETRISSQLKRLSSLKQQLDTLNGKLIPRAQKRIRLVENLSQRTMEGLDEHRTVMLDYIDLRLKALEVRYGYEMTSNEIQKLASSAVLP